MATRHAMAKTHLTEHSRKATWGSDTKAISHAFQKALLCKLSLSFIAHRLVLTRKAQHGWPRRLPQAKRTTAHALSTEIELVTEHIWAGSNLPSKVMAGVTSGGKLPLLTFTSSQSTYAQSQARQLSLPQLKPYDAFRQCASLPSSRSQPR